MPELTRDPRPESRAPHTESLPTYNASCLSDFAPQSAPLKVAFKPEPVADAESCGAKSSALLKTEEQGTKAEKPKPQVRLALPRRRCLTSSTGPSFDSIYFTYRSSTSTQLRPCRPCQRRILELLCISCHLCL